MDIDLSLLHSKTKEEIDITNTYTIPKEYYESTIVEKAENIKVTGKVYMNSSIDDADEEEDYIKAKIEGDIILTDSISLEPVSYPISIDFDDILEQNCKKDENTLDIFQFLWENIVLEVPIRITKSTGVSLHGDGWQLNEDENKDKMDPRFQKLDEFFKGGE